MDLGAKMAAEICRRLRMSRAESEAVEELIHFHLRFMSVRKMREAKLRRFLMSPLGEDHLALHRADCLGSHGDLSIFETATAALAALPPEREALLTGADVLALGVAQGPMVGELLRAAERALDEAASDPAGPLPTREQALAALREQVARRVKNDP